MHGGPREMERSRVECPRTPRGLPVALLVERSPCRRSWRPVWFAIGALVVAAPIWTAVRSSTGGRPPAAPGRAAPAGAAQPAQATGNPIHARVETPMAAEPGRNAGSREPAAAAMLDVAAEHRPAGLEQDLAHVKLWSATFAGGRALARAAASTGGPKASGSTRAIAELLRRALAHGALSPAPDAKTSIAGLRARALAGERSVALWLLAPGEGWGDPVERAKVTVRGLEPGRWRVTWLDDVSGAEIASEERDLPGDADLHVPTFARHVAAVLERSGAP